MMRNSGVPNVRHAQFFNFFECRIGKVGKFSNAIFFDGSPGFVGGNLVPKQACKYLINNNFMV